MNFDGCNLSSVRQTVAASAEPSTCSSATQEILQLNELRTFDKTKKFKKQLVICAELWVAELCCIILGDYLVALELKKLDQFNVNSSQKPSQLLKTRSAPKSRLCAVSALFHTYVFFSLAYFLKTFIYFFPPVAMGTSKYYNCILFIRAKVISSRA